MSEANGLTDDFERHRARLRAVAYRILGSHTEAEDALQEAWLRVSRSDADEPDNVAAWLTTVVARVCSNVLRSRKTRREAPVGVHVPDPVISRTDEATPEDEALLADSVGLALQVVLGTLNPSERLAFVLHDMFALPFDEIGPLVGRSSAAARQLASRARRRVQGAAVETPDADIDRQREVVDAFYAAARHGDLDALVAALAPDAVLRSDGGATRPSASVTVHGAAAVGRQALEFHQHAAVMWPVLVNGAAGVVLTLNDQPIAVMGFMVSNGRIVQIDAIADPERLCQLDLTMLK